MIKETWCFKCKKKSEIIDPVERITANNRLRWVGKCIECDGNLSLMGGVVSIDSDGRYRESKTAKAKVSR